MKKIIYFSGILFTSMMFIYGSDNKLEEKVQRLINIKESDFCAADVLEALDTLRGLLKNIKKDDRFMEFTRQFIMYSFFKGKWRDDCPEKKLSEDERGKLKERIRNRYDDLHFIMRSIYLKEMGINPNDRGEMTHHLILCQNRLTIENKIYDECLVVREAILFLLKKTLNEIDTFEREFLDVLDYYTSMRVRLSVLSGLTKYKEIHPKLNKMFEKICTTDKRKDEGINRSCDYYLCYTLDENDTKNLSKCLESKDFRTRCIARKKLKHNETTKHYDDICSYLPDIGEQVREYDLILNFP